MSERDDNAAEPTEMQEDESQASSVEAAGVESHQEAVGDPGDEPRAERQPRASATDPDGGGL